MPKADISVFDAEHNPTTKQMSENLCARLHSDQSNWKEKGMALIAM